MNNKKNSINEKYISSQMLQAIKRKAVAKHPWSFYSDESNYDQLEKELLDPDNEKDFGSIAFPKIDAIAKIRGNKITAKDKDDIIKQASEEINIMNEFTTMTYDLAYSTQLGFRIKMNPDVIHEISGIDYDDAIAFLERYQNNNFDHQDIMNSICTDTNMTDLIDYCLDNANTLRDINKFGCTRYLLFSTNPMHHVGLNKDNISSSGIMYLIQSVLIDGEYISITDTNYNPKTNSVLDSGARYILRRTEDNKIQIQSSMWDYVKNKDDLVHLMYSNCYVGIISPLSAIQELIERETITKDPKTTYTYSIDHIPSNILKDGKIHYTKYNSHLSENPYYPKNRKSPRLHMVKGYFRSNGTYVSSYPRGTDEELMSYVQNIIGEECKGENGMVRTLTPKQLDAIAPVIANELRKAKGKDSVKQIANKYKIDQSLVRSIAKTRRTGLSDITIVETDTEDNIVNVDNNETTKSTTTSDNVSNDSNSTKRKPKVILTDEQKLELVEYFNSGEYTASELAEMYDIHQTTVNRILSSFSGKIEVVPRPSSYSRAKISDEVADKVVTEWESGQFKSHQELANNIGISYSSVYRILKKFYNDKPIPTRKQIIENLQKQDKGEGNEDDMGETHRSLKKAKSKKMNSHQYKKMHSNISTPSYLKNFETSSNNDIDVEDHEVSAVNKITENVYMTDSRNNVSVVRNKTFEEEFCNLNLVRIKKPETTVEAELVSGRHDTNIDKYVFTGPLTNEQLFDFEWQEKVCNDFINSNITFDENGDSNQTLILYCTGIQSCLASLDKVCYDRHVNLVLKHYNDITKTYISQIKYDCFGSVHQEVFPFEKLSSKGALYAYKCDINSLLENQTKLYCISVNEYNGSNNSFSSQDFILFTDIKDAWEAYPEIVDKVQSNTKNKRSVFLTACSIKMNDFMWMNNISRSYNFK